MSDKGALITSQAGMRLIAQQTLINRGDFERLRAYIAGNYTAGALESQPVEDRLAEIESLIEQAGKLRFYQVIGVGKHQVVVVMEAQRSASFYLIQMVVEEDYPHKIAGYTQQPLDGNT